MRKLPYVLTLVLALSMLGPVSQANAAGGQLPLVKATGYELMDAETGQVLLAHNPNVRLAPASTTKIMTALLTIEKGDLSRVVRVSPAAYGVQGSTVYLVPGQRLTIRNLLYGLLLVSGNDAAVELAVADAGSVPKFVAEMNQKARELGATHTTFLNPDGLYLSGHRTTAHDMALFAQAALALPEFRTIDATRQYLFPGYPHSFVIYNQNQLLTRYPGAIGVKIGYTIQADESIVGAATRNGVTLIAVALHTDYYHLWTDPQNLLNWGFQNFSQVDVLKTGSAVGRAHDGAHAIATAGYQWLSGPGQPMPKMKVSTFWPAAWKRGQPIGMARVYSGSRELALVPLVASAGSPAPPPPHYGNLVLIGAILVLGLLMIAASRRRARRRRVRYRFKVRPRRY